jgi:CheY-like chemotaxis protein
VTPQAAAKSLTITYHADPDLPRVIISDITRVRQILFNLLSNAIKFTDSGGVTVSASPVAAARNDRVELQFTVDDTGIGIPADRLNKLFQSFTQVDASTTRRYGGTGLGLAICRRLTELLGGTIWVESTLGRGSRFSFTIRTEVAPDSAIAPKASLTEQHNAAPAGSRLADRHPLRVLVAEDNLVNQKVTLAMLAKLGYRADLATTGLEAVNAVRLLPYDVVFMDLQMPELDGIDATRQIINDHPISQRPRIVALTANAFADDKEECLSAGMDDYLSKPLDVKELAASLDRVTRRS